MRLSIWCLVHEAEVVPLDDRFNWFAVNFVRYQMKRNVPTFEAPSQFELDPHSFNCTGGHGEHNFIVTIEADEGVKYNFAV